MNVSTQGLGVAAALAAARLTDRPQVKRRVKGALIAVNVATLVLVIWLALLCLK